MDPRNGSTDRLVTMAKKSSLFLATTVANRRMSFLNAPTSEDMSKPCAHIVNGDLRLDQVVPTRESDQTGHTKLPHQGVSR